MIKTIQLAGATNAHERATAKYKRLLFRLGFTVPVIFAEDFFVSLHLVTSQETRFIALTGTVYKLIAEREGLITRRKGRVNELTSWHVYDNSCLFPRH
jgi:hypothetical protein